MQAWTQRSRPGRGLKLCAATVLVSLGVFFGLMTGTARVRVQGTSMEPTLRPGDFVLINRVTRLFGGPSRGDVVVLGREGSDRIEYIKRLVGLPKDVLEVRRGVAYINGRGVVRAPNDSSAVLGGQAKRILGANECFVLGDNWTVSVDSRQLGPFSLDDLIGTAWLVYWPPADFGLIHPSSLGGGPPFDLSTLPRGTVVGMSTIAPNAGFF